MAKFFRNENDIGYLEITWLELAEYLGNGFPICDSCLKDLIGYNNIILLPALNEAYCKECGKKRVAETKDYPSDREIRYYRENFYKEYFGI